MASLSPFVGALVAPPAGKVGWPWTLADTHLSGAVEPDEAWPRISIVTPSYNQGQFIEETIRSVLLQGYPNLEYIIIDGGSTDGSVEIIRKYAPWLTYWVSEPDRGQADAIEKGLAMATGAIFNWINSDDLLTPGALFAIAHAFEATDAVGGGVANFGNGTEGVVWFQRNLSARGLILHSKGVIFHQPGLWLRRDNVRACGGIDDTLHYAFDRDLIIRYLHLFPRVVYVDEILARFRLHPGSKTVTAVTRFFADEVAIVRTLQQRPEFSALHATCRDRLPLNSWLLELLETARDTQRARWRRAVAITIAACKAPRTRWSRFTLGTLRRLIFAKPLV